jgi:hypothetical protein
MGYAREVGIIAGIGEVIGEFEQLIRGKTREEG